MTQPSARIILDSISEDGHRLTTMEVVMHRFVLAEFNTHRKNSRNSASSRAVPVDKKLLEYIEDPAYPEVWASEKSGMQGGEELTGQDLFDAKRLFYNVNAYTAAAIQVYLEDHPTRGSRLHKSLINRLLEPMLWHTAIVSATEWENFFSQRRDNLAQPEMSILANAMHQALEESIPTPLPYGRWHLPFISPEEKASLHITTSQVISAARCARVSYLTHMGVRDIKEDVSLFGKLVRATPEHWSPLEHVATPSFVGSGNFDGWAQLRHLTLSHLGILNSAEKEVGIHD